MLTAMTLRGLALAACLFGFSACGKDEGKEQADGGNASVPLPTTPAGSPNAAVLEELPPVRDPRVLEWIAGLSGRIATDEDRDYFSSKVLAADSDDDLIGVLGRMASSKDAGLKRIASHYLALAYPISCGEGKGAIIERALTRLSEDADPAARRRVVRDIGRYDAPLVRTIAGRLQEDGTEDITDPAHQTVGAAAVAVLSSLKDAEADARVTIEINQGKCQLSWDGVPLRRVFVGEVSENGTQSVFPEAMDGIRFQIETHGSLDAISSQSGVTEWRTGYKITALTKDGGELSWAKSSGSGPYGVVKHSSANIKFLVWTRKVGPDRMRFWIYARLERA